MTIVMFDSDRYYQQVVNMILMPAELSVSACALGRERAVDLIKAVSAGKFNPDIALIDTLLESNHEEGVKVAEKLKQFAPDCKIIAYTTLNGEEIPWANAIAIKGSKTSETSLIEALKKLGVNLEKGDAVDRS